MSLGGKRLRPLLSLMSYYLFNEDFDKVIKPAIAIEVFHNFTLMHDDIMDNAPLRRGKPTVHEKWNNNVAILSGDVMLVKAYDLLLEAEESKIKSLIKAFNVCAAGVCEGQQLDVDFEQIEHISEAQYIQMITLKTGILLGFSMELGAILADANSKSKQHLKEFGINIGIAFQLKDDLLDVFGDSQKFGKKVGGDIAANKKTFLLIKALELANTEDKEALKALMSDKAAPELEKVSTITKLYEKLNIPELTGNEINEYYKKAIKCLNEVDADLHKKHIIKRFVDELMVREN